jgi:hypothetical protein
MLLGRRHHEELFLEVNAPERRCLMTTQKSIRLAVSDSDSAWAGGQPLHCACPIRDLSECDKWWERTGTSNSGRGAVGAGSAFFDSAGFDSSGAFALLKNKGGNRRKQGGVVHWMTASVVR